MRHQPRRTGDDSYDGQIFGWTHAILLTESCDSGLGRHVIYLTGPDQLSDSLKYGFMSIPLGFLSPMAGRISFCIFVLWIAGNDSRIKKWPIYVSMAVQVIVNLLQVIIWTAQCGTHLNYIWNPSKTAEVGQDCWDPIIQTQIGYFSGCEFAYLSTFPGSTIAHVIQL